MKKLSTILFLTLCFSPIFAQWESLGSGTSTTPRTYFALEVIDTQIIWAVAIHPSGATASDEIVKSIDGGETWEVFTLPTLTETYYTLAIQAIDENIAWVLLVNLPNQDKTKIFKTTDGGINWTEQLGQFNDVGQTVASLYFFNEMEGLAFGSPGTGDAAIDSMHVYQTVDSGETWEDIELPALMSGEGNWLYSGNGGYEVKGDTLWFLTRKSRVLRTIDKGTTWEIFDTGIHAGQGLASISFKDSQNGIVTGAQPNRAARTEDGGETWTEISIPSSPHAAIVEYIPGTEDTYIIASVGFLGGLKFATSRDGGTSWDTRNLPQILGCIEFVSPTIGFAGGAVSSSQNKGLFKWTEDLGDPMYVNHEATGENNGTSWEDAYTNLQIALDNGQNYPVWVAKGVYTASSPSMHPDSTFFQDTVGVRLYGGFDGTETYFYERNAETNLTVLSGDLLSDDIESSFEDNRSDNGRHVLWIVNSGESILDGFTISGGHAIMSGEFGPVNTIGGGVVSAADLIVNNCTFIHNQAAQGGAMTGQNDAFVVTHCKFIQNRSNFGALIAVIGTGETFIISDNLFEENTATDFGGGLTVGNCEAIIENNIFDSNSAGGEGGGLFLFQNDSFEGGKSFSVINNDFINNHANAGAGLNFNNFNNGSILNMSDCYFEGNVATTKGGGAIMNNITGLLGTLDYTLTAFLKNNTFLGNSAESGGGLNLYNLSDSLTVSILASTFESNIATTNGGAINLDVASFKTMNVEMDGLIIIDNKTDENGGGLYLDVGAPCRLTNSIISENDAAAGAAIYLESSSNMDVENVLIANSIGSDAIHNRATLNLLGVTCVDNSIGLVDNGIATTSFQNTIMSNTENYIGAGTLISKGGNLSSDATLLAAFVGAGGFDDFNETAPMLDAGYIPTESSPCVDAGNPNDISQEEDLAGNGRIQGNQIDIGAYETPFVVSIKDIYSSANIEITPNPVNRKITIKIGEQLSGNTLDLTIISANGQVIQKLESANRKQITLDVNDLPKGLYILKISGEAQAFSKKFIKD